ncbi:NAD(P)-binding domain-containing protein, partial [Fusobacterium mortiferum]
MKLGFIGCGNMGEAFLKGIINSEEVETKNIYVYDKLRGKEVADRYSVTLLSNELAIVEECDIIFLAVKPNVYFDVIDKIKDSVNSSKIIV